MIGPKKIPSLKLQDKRIEKKDVGKVMSLLFNMLSRLVITFLPRNKRLLISWLQSPSAVILEPRKIKSDIVSTVCSSVSHIKCKKNKQQQKKHQNLKEASTEDRKERKTG